MYAANRTLDCRIHTIAQKVLLFQDVYAIFHI